MEKRITLRDVAKYCGVSAMTVSCVVRDAHCVKESTRKKVEQAIKELGYVVDPTLRALAAYRTNSQTAKGEKYKANIAFLDADNSKYNHALFKCCHDEGMKLGYKLNYYRLPVSYEDQTAFSKFLWTQGIRGILLGPTEGEFNLEGFQFERFAIVGIGAFHHQPPLDSVTSDYFHGLYMAAGYCASQGLKNIGFFLNSYLESRSGHRWLGAYHAFCHHYNRKPIFWIYDIQQRPTGAQLTEWITSNQLEVILTLSTFIHPSPDRPHLKQFYLNDWNVVPGAQCVSTSLQLLAKESIGLLDQHLVLHRYGVPESPKQISIMPVLHVDGSFCV